MHPSATKGDFWLLKKTLFGLRRSPRRWFDKIDKILKAMGLESNPYDPASTPAAFVFQRIRRSQSQLSI